MTVPSPPAAMPAPAPPPAEVARFLREHRLGDLTTPAPTLRPGRNPGWAGITDRGEAVFVKQVDARVHTAADAADRVRRAAAAAAVTGPGTDLPAPRLRAADPVHGLIAFEWLSPATTAAELLSTDDLSAADAHRTGELLGAVHRTGPPAAVADAGEHPLPPTAGLAGLTPAAYANASAAELELWALLHDDPPLADALRQLRARERSCARTLVHGDLRLDQLLRHHGEWYLTDWEECRVADPARDLGGFAGELLHRAVLGLRRPDGAATADDDPQAALAAGVREFERLRPLITACWRGYRAARPDAAADQLLAQRAVAWTGWHLFDRVFAIAQGTARLTPLERAAAGVGRTALTSPADLVDTIGFTEDASPAEEAR